MSKKYGNPCATYNIPLNNDENDVFRTGCVHLYNFLHCKSTEYKSLMLKMHLEFVDSSLMTEAEGKNIEQQLKEEIKSLTDALQQSKNDGNQLMDRIDKLEKNNSLDYDRINALLSSSGNAPRQSVQQLEAKIKTLEDALLREDRLKDDIKKIMDYVVRLEPPLSINAIERAADIVNNTSQDKSKKQACDENNLIGDDSPLTGEAEEQNNSNNAILQPVQHLEARNKTLEDALLRTKSDGSKLTECVEKVEKNKAVDNAPHGGNNTTQDNSIEQMKQASSDSHSNQQSYGCTIWNIKRKPIYNKIGDVITLAKQIGLSLTRDQINNIDVYDVGLDSRNYCVHFCNKALRDEFLKKSHILKEFSETKDLTISNEAEYYHTVVIKNVKTASCPINNVIDIAKQMYLWLTHDQIKHVDVFRTYRRNDYVYCVYFSTKRIKDTFLEKSHILKEIGATEHLQFY